MGTQDGELHGKKSLCQPLVSVCCITYNHGPYIAQAIESFLMQETNFPFEIIIHDDASTDGTAEIVRNYANTHPNLIRTILQTENQYSKGENISSKTFAVAEGKYIALCEGDDYWTDPRKLALQAEFLERNQDCVMCYGNVALVDAAGAVVQPRRIQAENCRTITREELIADGGLTPTCTVMFQNHPVLRSFPRPPQRVLNGDRFLFAMLGQFGSAGYVDFSPSHYRQHGGGVYSTMDEDRRRVSMLNTYHVLRRRLRREFRPLAASVIAKIRISRSAYLRKHGVRGEFIRNLAAFFWFSAAHRCPSGFARDCLAIAREGKRFVKRVLHTYRHSGIAS